MNKEQNRSEEYVVTFSDFLGVIKKHRFKIFLITIAFTLMAGILALNRPVKYSVEASFKEKGMATSNTQGPTLGALLGGKSSNKQSEAKTWFTSHKLLKSLVLELDLHGVIDPKEQPLFRFHKVMKDNLKVELAYLRKRSSPRLEDPVRPVYLSNVIYDDELPLELEVTFPSEDEYLLKNVNNELVGHGKYGEPFHYRGVSFTVHRDERYPLEHDTYLITLSSPDRVAKGLKEIINLKNDPLDSELVYLWTVHPDRHRAAQLMNTLISLYKEHKVDEQRRVSQEQIAYLEERQDEAAKNLKKAMGEFAKEQSKDFEKSGFVNTDNALEFLALRQQEHQRRLLAIELENKRLEKVLNEGYVFYDRYSADGDSSVINQLLNEIRQLKQQADSIKLSLQESPVPFDDMENLTFNRQMAELEDTQSLIMELRAIDKELAHNHLIRPSDSLMNDPRIMLHNWYEKLREYQQEREWSQLSASDWENRKAQFATYIRNLIQLFEVHEKALRERLAHHGDLKEEFKGIDLKLANELFMNYNRALNDTEAQLVKLQFILDRMQQPNFEINSLTSQLTDSISSDLINKHSKLLLDLQDENNRSQKEQERIRNELLRQRKFLEMHIAQSITVHNLTANLQRNKINSLQKVSLALIQLKISLIEKQLENFIASRIGNLQNEKLVIEEQLLQIKKEMAAIPEKKISEQIMQQRLEQSRDFGKEITHLVESKNITNNLEVILSKTVDEAIVPVFPRKPMVLVFSAVGAFVGLAISIFYVCLTEAIKGVTATPENMSSMGFSVSGLFRNGDLSVLRRVMNALTLNTNDKSIVFSGSQAFSIAKQFTSLLAKRDQSSLVILLSPDVEKVDTCLFDYLEGKVESLSIDKKSEFDLIAPNRTSLYSSELIASERFTQYIQRVSSQYDWIIIASAKEASSSEVELLLRMFDQACVSLSGDRLDNIKTSMLLAKDPSKTITFIWG